VIGVDVEVDDSLFVVNSSEPLSGLSVSWTNILGMVSQSLLI
jgi:hypothetical protein